MSLRYSIIPAAAATDPDLKGRDLAVLCVLGRHTKKHGWCVRSQVKMAGELGCARSTVQASLSRLVDAGYVQHKRIVRPSGGEAAHMYRVLLDQDGPVDAFDEADADADPLDVVGADDGEGALTPADIPAPPCRYTGTPADPGSAPPADSGSAPRLTSKDKRSSEREGADAPPPDTSDGGTPDGSTSGVAQDVGPDFDSGFWRKWFNRGVDSKTKARVAYDRLSADEKRAAIAGIKPYKAMMDAAGRKKIPAAFTYLDEKKWEDLGSEPDANANGLPPEVKPYSPLWTATVIELLRTKAVPRNRFAFKHLCEGKSVNLMFDRKRNGELVSAAEAFKPARADSAAGRAFLIWLEGQLADQRLHHLMPLFREDFGLHLPPPAIAREWGLSLPGAEPTSHPPPDTEDDISAAFN